MSNVLFELRRINFAYDDTRPVLRGLDFTLRRGERVALTGPNGCGKSTLLHIMTGLLKPSSGTLVAFGRTRREEKDFHEVRRRTGLLFQDVDDQLFCPTVIEDVAFGPLNLGLDRHAAVRRARAVLGTLGLDDFEDRITFRLSEGEKRLVALAGVLAMEPEVILLDEPMAGLDETAARRVEEIILTLPQTLVIIAHDTDFLARLTRRTLRLHAGRLQETPPDPFPLHASPADAPGGVQSMRT